MRLEKLKNQQMTGLEKKSMSKLLGASSPDKWPCYDGCQNCEGGGPVNHMAAGASSERVSATPDIF